MQSIQDKAQKRIAHIKDHLAGGYDVPKLVNYVRNGLGNPRACLMALAGYAQASALYSWFALKDLAATRSWFHEAARCDRLGYEMEHDVSGPGAKALQLLKPLISNDNELIDWFAHHEDAYDANRIQDHRTHDFWAYQAVVALRQDWATLESRCRKVIADPPKAASEQRYLLDHQFYLALAQGDEERMQEVLEQLLQPKRVRARDSNEGGYSADLISTPAVIFAKLAWRRGCRIQVKSPLVPAEWLPLDSPPSFERMYEI